MHLEAIDNDLWYVVENGVPSVTPTINVADVKRFKQLDSQAKNIICGHLSKGHTGDGQVAGLFVPARCAGAAGESDAGFCT